MSNIAQHLKTSIDAIKVVLLLEEKTHIDNHIKLSIHQAIDRRRDEVIKLPIINDIITISRTKNLTTIKFNKTYHKVTEFIVDYCDDYQYIINECTVNGDIMSLVIEKE